MNQQDPIPFQWETLDAHVKEESLLAFQKETQRIVDNAKQQLNQIKSEKAEEIHLLEQQISELNAQKNDLLDKIEKEKKRLSTLEENFCAELHQQAQTDGFQQGLEEGKESGRREGLQNAGKKIEEQVSLTVQETLEQQTTKYYPLLDKITAELENARQDLLSLWEKNILQIAASIAFHVIQKELPSFQDVSLILLREALEMAVGCSSLKIRLNPNEIRVFEKPISLLIQRMLPACKVDLLSDVDISPGGCLVESSIGIIDQRLESRIERIVSELAD